MITRNISIELWSKYHPEIFVVQGETSGRVFAITFLSHGVTLPLADKTVSVYDGELVALTISGDTVLFAPTTALTRTVAFKIEKSGVILHSFDVTVTVLDSLAIPEKVFLTNLVSNGNFVDATGWTVQSATLSAAENIMSVTGNGTNAWGRIYQNLTVKPQSNVLYASVMARVTNTSCANINVRLRDGALSGGIMLTITKTSPTKDQWYPLINIVTTKADAYASTLHILIDHFYADAATANGKVMEVKYVMCENETLSFGAGNEPTQADMTDIMEQFPHSWFNGTALAYLP